MLIKVNIDEFPCTGKTQYEVEFDESLYKLTIKTQTIAINSKYIITSK